MDCRARGRERRRVAGLVIGGCGRQRDQDGRNVPGTQLRDRHHARARHREIARGVRVGDRRQIRRHAHRRGLEL